MYVLQRMRKEQRQRKNALLWSMTGEDAYELGALGRLL